MPAAVERNLDDLLEAFQLRDPLLSEEFHALAGPKLRRWARRKGWGLPKDAIEEVVQEVFLAVSNPVTVRFDRTRGTATEYLTGRLLNALKTIQTVNGLRRLGSDFNSEGQREFVPIDDLELMSANVIPFEAINARHLVRKMFTGMEATVLEACRRVWVEDEPQAAVAETLGMSRFALARKLATVRALSVQFQACM
jgi:DNA-directed RNA polymerase specialized sigma24 family protein